MSVSELVIALRNGIERGESLEQAKVSLLNAGYSRAEVEEAAREIEKLKPRPILKPAAKFLPLPKPPKTK